MRLCRLLRFVNLVQWGHGSRWMSIHLVLRVMEALVFRLVTPAFEDRFILLNRYAVRVMEASVNRRVERSAQEVASTLLHMLVLCSPPRDTDLRELLRQPASDYPESSLN